MTTFTNTTNPNSPDYKPRFEEITASYIHEFGDSVTMDVCGTVYNEDVYDITGVLVIDGGGDYPINDDSVAYIKALFGIDLKKKLFEEAYKS